MGDAGVAPTTDWIAVARLAVTLVEGRTHARSGRDRCRIEDASNVKEVALRGGQLAYGVAGARL